MLYISVLNSLFSNSLAVPIRFIFTMTLFTFGFLYSMVLLILYCPVRSGENEVTSINDEPKEDKIKGIQDGGNVSKKPRNRNSIAVRIVNGIKTKIKSHPYLAALVKNNNHIYCGGSIISSEFILTAAHCLANKTTGEVYPVEDRSVFLGVHNQFILRNGKEFRIINAIVHENFSKKGFEGFIHYDIGLLKINPQIDYNPFIQKICLPDHDTNVIDSSTIGTVQGWGRDSPRGDQQQYVMKTTYKIISGEECSKLFPYKLPDHDSVLCGVDNIWTHVSGTCSGDSGGPFVTEKADGLKVLIGIISYGVNCNIEYQNPDVFTRVSHFLPWIFSHVPQSTVCVVDT